MVSFAIALQMRYNTSMSKGATSFRLSDDSLASLAKLAKDFGRSKTAVIEAAIKHLSAIHSSEPELFVSKEKLETFFKNIDRLVKEMKPVDGANAHKKKARKS